MAPHDLREVLPGLVHWTTHHEGIGAPVSSYFAPGLGVVLDPQVPDGGLEALREHGTPQQVVLSTGLHARHAAEVAAAFDCPVRAPREAADRLAGRLEFEPFGDGDEVAPGVTAVQVGALCPDEYALLVDVDGGALVLADAVLTYGGTLAFVPDSLMGDDPETVKRGLTDALRGLLGRDFEHLLPAHGDPVVGSGKTALRAFLD